MGYTFQPDGRLGILLPALEMAWHEYEPADQYAILEKWECIRGRIPDRIAEIEEKINTKQARLNIEENFETSCRLNSEIAELASIINDLWIWYRTRPDVTDCEPVINTADV
ncbi:hypothetical protein [Alteribacillus sp. HJP-4]|uniref:hypothetical protein n=1 Tax=Alteribacillus sp. HJP-4 TaxID=2775394 RepID=UPI0035CD05FC